MQTGVITKIRPPDQQESEPEKPEEYDELEGIAEDILRAINMKDAKSLAEALRDAFEVIDAAPHVEGEHINESEEG
jgi:hypothetical protein